MNKKNKRGVSPLIATVLLIAFAVALGAVVMNWGRSYVQDTAEDVRTKSDRDVKCSQDVGIEVQKIDTTPQMCYGGSGTAGFLDFTIYNKGHKNIASLTVTIVGSTAVYTNSSVNGTSVNIGQMMRKNMSYSYTTYGSIQLVKIVPEITLGGVLTACSGNALEKGTSDLRNCSG